MSTTLFEDLRNDPDMRDPDFRHSFAESHLNSAIAMQIKVLREQREWSQGKLGEEAGRMAQSRISIMEDVNYSSWSLTTLKRLARAFDLRLKVSFEEFGSLAMEMDDSGREGFERQSFDYDPEFAATPPIENQETVSLAGYDMDEGDIVDDFGGGMHADNSDAALEEVYV